MKPPPISHPHKDSLFLVIEESGVELSYDLLIPIVPKLQQLSDLMQVTSLKNPTEMHILLLPHIINVNPLMFDHRRCLWVKHSPVPILMKECPESLTSASFLRQAIARLVAEMHHIHGIFLAVIHNFLIGVDLWRIHL
jgi:hypothetical protein